MALVTSRDARILRRSILRCERDTPEMGDRVAEAFDEGAHQNAKPVFEHGQWWINCSTCGAQWSAADSNGKPEFVFERISQGDGYCDEAQAANE